MYIFRWVVSSDLDMRALEQLSLVCRGFYICARSAPLSSETACLLTACFSLDLPLKILDQEILSHCCCTRDKVIKSQFCAFGFHSVLNLFFKFLFRDPEIWHLACVRVWGRNCTKVVPFKSWREMFLRRPRVRFDGNYMQIWDALSQFKTSTAVLYFPPVVL